MLLYRKKRFKNLPGSPLRKFGFFNWLAFFIRRLLDHPPVVPDYFVVPKQQILPLLAQNKDTLTWLGHAAFLIRLNGQVILIDPFLTDYASPIVGLGPKRFIPSPLTVTDLPPVNMIIISHDHYDHLDKRTVAVLPNKSSIHVVVPLCLGDFFRKLGYLNIHELDWHESITINDVLIRALPAYHFSKRSLFTSNTTLWASYAISWQNKQLYFSGNTAYGPIFPELGKDYGPFDYALMSIGAYEPDELMKANHQTPELAVQTAKELRAKILIPMHWGTITLSDEPPFEPPVRFYNAAINAGFPAENIWTMKIGETRTI